MKLLLRLSPLFLSLAACAGMPPPQARVLLYGEQHDQPDQQRQVAQAVRDLAAQQRLAAVVLEMAEQGGSTARLAAGADEAAVQEALRWSAAAWPWDSYKDVVMAAVRAEVPVLGGNLPRSGMRAAMQDEALDGLLPAAVNDQLKTAIREGHCGLLPAEHEGGMLRIQLARDQSMARAVAQAAHDASPGQQVLLLSGAQHAARDRGVPLHLQRLGFKADELFVTMFGASDGALPSDRLLPATHSPGPDPCEPLRKRQKD
ncbi:ChaN family lipoprotein [Azohydromonas caseinilytica]|uniref:ChaN family lipoprotein n=1 Tax=Azohydromonas caseinilytica TaxID=2728836 RepID=A0A848F697_9BURK|nr:ChaN family lipoprotein [Azohydromonas caseinilytica]NML14206.1 ChaN family lipoprotein [Azohydromonas caseinilytica]